ncbi:MAG TPA: hypothetical protein VF244_09990, partial [Acidimicrobiales bacterium]
MSEAVAAARSKKGLEAPAPPQSEAASSGGPPAEGSGGGNPLGFLGDLPGIGALTGSLDLSNIMPMIQQAQAMAGPMIGQAMGMAKPL